MHQAWRHGGYRSLCCGYASVQEHSLQVLWGESCSDPLCQEAPGMVYVAPEQFKWRAECVLTAEQREQALAKRHAPGEEFWSWASKEKGELALGSTFMVQTQRGPTKGRWDTSGTVVDILEHNSYLVKMDRSGRLSKQRLSFLKPIVAHRDDIAKIVWEV